ncbi:MAG: glycosyltransferase family 39 protein [Thermosynechococcaceae cyanobacterium]
MRALSPKSWGLATTILLGAILRFWNLDLKPLWMDETITALFSLGHSYSEVALGQVQPLAKLSLLFQWQPTSCAAIAEAIRTQSTHPPLFFCWLHQWLGWVDRFDLSLAWKVRSLPAFLGILAIPAVYRLNRLAFSPSAGLAAALMMAVSPFAVYLSQEARHYTLPMLLLTLSLVGLVLMLQDLCERQVVSPGIWVGWVILNGLGFYTHYFYALAVMAQILTMLGLTWLYRAKLPRRAGGVIGLAIAGIVLIDLPLLPQFIEHLQQPATDWLNLTTSDLNLVTPLLRLLAGFILMVVMLPIEDQSIAITIGSGLIMLLFSGWLWWRTVRGWVRLWRNAATRLSLLILGSVLSGLLLEYLVVIYGLGKDLTLAFRYNFMLYPLACALISAGLTAPPALEWEGQQRSRRFANIREQSLQRDLPLVAAVGLISSVCVVSGLAFLKPFQPGQIVQHLQTNPPALVVQTYDSWQSVAFGLSLVANLPQTEPMLWLFQAPQDIKKLVINPTYTTLKSLWLFSALSNQAPFPTTFTVQSGAQSSSTSICRSSQKDYQAMNIKYRDYHCVRNAR